MSVNVYRPRCSYERKVESMSMYQSCGRRAQTADMPPSHWTSYGRTRGRSANMDFLGLADENQFDLRTMHRSLSDLRGSLVRGHQQLKDRLGVAGSDVVTLSDSAQGAVSFSSMLDQAMSKYMAQRSRERGIVAMEVTKFMDQRMRRAKPEDVSLLRVMPLRDPQSGKERPWSNPRLASTWRP